MKRGTLIIIGAITLVTGISAFLIYQVIFHPTGLDIDKEKYPITGIDISGHTGEIAFSKIPERNIDFIYMKATEGEDFVDSRFESNYDEIKKYNIPFGFYHFFKFSKNGRMQAEFFWKTVQQRSFDLPLVIDVEEWGNCSNKEPGEIIQNMKDFVNFMEKKTGKAMMIYTNESRYKKFIEGNFKNKVWICSFSTSPNIPQSWTLWQHSHKGKFDWAQGWVDINTFNGTRIQWVNFLKE